MGLSDIVPDEQGRRASRRRPCEDAEYLRTMKVYSYFLVIISLCLISPIVSDGLTYGKPALSFINFDLGSCTIPGSFILGTKIGLNMLSNYTDSDGSCSGEFSLIYFRRSRKNLTPSNFELFKFDAIEPTCDSPCKWNGNIKRERGGLPIIMLAL